jgi:glycerol-3-phosphate dehydrogenase
MDAEATVVGAGVVGAASALALARRGVSVAVVEANEPGSAASGANSGIVHTGFDSTPGELETELIIRSGELRPAVLDAIGAPFRRCGATVRGPEDELARGARRNGVEVVRRGDGLLDVPGEAITDPLAYTLGLVAATRRFGTEVRTGFLVASIRTVDGGLALESEGGEVLGSRVVINCAGLHADVVARLAGDDSFQIYPRKGEFLVFEPPADETLDRILLPAPTRRTKGVLVFPTIDGKVIAGPTAVDQDDKSDWSVRPAARSEILPQAAAMWPPLEGATEIAAYAGLRPAGRGVNYLIERSRACERLINVAAIRSTGLTASPGIAERVCRLVERAGLELRPEALLEPAGAAPAAAPWWELAAQRS